MNVRVIGLRLAVFLGVLVLTLIPGPVGMAIPAETGILNWIVGPAWLWQIMATLPVGIARVPYDGTIYFANSSQLLALVFWLLIGVATAVALRRVRLSYFAGISLALILVCGVGAHLLLSVFGYAMFMRP